MGTHRSHCKLRALTFSQPQRLSILCFVNVLCLFDNILSSIHISNIFFTGPSCSWGSKRMGKRTGIIFNNLMGDFSLPNKPSWTDDAWTAPSNQNNWIEPKKRPLSSMSPTIVLDKNGDVRLVTGGSGGSKIITAASMVSLQNSYITATVNS